MKCRKQNTWSKMIGSVGSGSTGKTYTDTLRQTTNKKSQ